MATSQACDPTNPNAQAFLKLLRWLENYPRDDEGVYLRLYGGGTFSNTKSHPNQAVSKWGHKSTAAGAYMILFGTWKEAVDKGIVSDFTQASQDEIAWWRIKYRKAQDAVCGGQNSLDDAFDLLSDEWSSLPGGSQTRFKGKNVQAVKNKYQTYLIQFQQRSSASSSTQAMPATQVKAQ